MVDKFSQKQKPDTLQYYLLVELEKQMIITYKKTTDLNWQAFTHNNLSDIVDLPQLNISITLKEIYQA
ncbi:MAG: hypothetical protein H7254_19775 [Ferruginibacter sp.]|nr:hypothetical protein [Ferruginibacter sp.]MBC7629524.1 hypothetical protein [Ferruginibacter sp.]